ncbi:MAG: hypothetical protein OXC11_06940 [Rhodospirillales bacterium]|nr:hypothetical protein [Rhodospirillales bacterium]
MAAALAGCAVAAFLTLARAWTSGFTASVAVAFDSVVGRAALTGVVDLAAVLAVAAFALPTALPFVEAPAAFLLAADALVAAAASGLARADDLAAVVAFREAVAAEPFDPDGAFTALAAVLVPFVGGVAAAGSLSARAADVLVDRFVGDADLEAVRGLRRALPDVDLPVVAFVAVALMDLGFSVVDQTGRRNGRRVRALGSRRPACRAESLPIQPKCRDSC